MLSIVCTPRIGSKYANQKFGADWFTEADLWRFDSPTSLLNDMGIDGSAFILQQLFSGHPLYHHSAQWCAIFSMHALSQVHYKAADPILWRHTQCAEYWWKDIWIIPIHRPWQMHWVLAIAHLRASEVYLYDSFAGRNEWKKDIPVKCCFSYCLISWYSFLACSSPGHLPSHHVSVSIGQQPGTPTGCSLNGMGCKTGHSRLWLNWITHNLWPFGRFNHFSQMGMTVDSGSLPGLELFFRG